MKREIKFRFWDRSENRMTEWADALKHIKRTGFAVQLYFEDDAEMIAMQFTGLKDKNGNDIYEGDVLTIRMPIRTSQTHVGDNIPLGSYTEPLEPEINENKEVVIFSDGCFCTGDTEKTDVQSPLMYNQFSYTTEQAKEGFAGGWTNYKPYGKWDWEGEDGDLSYLLETYKLQNEDELVKYLGVEIVGNIYENPELLKPTTE